MPNVSPKSSYSQFQALCENLPGGLLEVSAKLLPAGKEDAFGDDKANLASLIKIMLIFQSS